MRGLIAGFGRFGVHALALLESGWPFKERAGTIIERLLVGALCALAFTAAMSIFAAPGDFAHAMGTPGRLLFAGMALIVAAAGTIYLPPLLLRLFSGGWRVAKSRIKRAPAARAEQALRFIFPRKQFDEIFGQTIEDMRIEHFDALESGQLWLARWRLLQLYISFAAILVMLVPVGSGKMFLRLWRMVG